jgi:hypothetical protein
MVMKIQHDLNKLAKVSFSTIPKFNPMVGEPILDGKGNQVYEDEWLEIPSAVARSLEELQDRIAKLEKLTEQFIGEDKIIALLEAVDRKSKVKEKAPVEPPPPGIPLSKVKKGRKPKVNE